MPAPARVASTVAPRAPGVLGALEHQRCPAPSPRTKPSRALSNGRDAAGGSSCRVDSARICAKPASGSGCRQASVPPATTTSTRPARIRSSASAMASAPDAQALTGVCTPPRAPSASPTRPAGPLGISIGTVCGETRRAPLASRTSSWASIVSAPPMPVPTTTASRSGSTPGAPACSHASSAASRASCWDRSRVRARTRPRRSTGSVGDPGAEPDRACPRPTASSSRAVPERPASRRLPRCRRRRRPSGVTAPRPVTTTSAREPGHAGTPAPADVGDGVADGLEVARRRRPGCARRSAPRRRRRSRPSSGSRRRGRRRRTSRG